MKVIQALLLVLISVMILSCEEGLTGNKNSSKPKAKGTIGKEIK